MKKLLPKVKGLETIAKIASYVYCKHHDTVNNIRSLDLKWSSNLVLMYVPHRASIVLSQRPNLKLTTLKTQSAVWRTHGNSKRLVQKFQYFFSAPIVWLLYIIALFWRFLLTLCSWPRITGKKIVNHPQPPK